MIGIPKIQWTRISPVSAAIQAKLLQRQHQGNEDPLIGQEHADQEEDKERICSPEPPLGKHIAVDRADQRGDEGGGNVIITLFRKLGDTTAPGLHKLPK